MLTKVPSSMQVRILRPQSEESVPHVVSEEILIESPALVLKFLKKILSGSGISILIGAVIFGVMKLVGLEFGGIEASIIILFPAMLGFLTSLVIF